MDSSSQFAKALASARTFAGLSAQQLEKLYQFCSIKVFARGETVFVAGEPVDELAIVLSGRLCAQQKGQPVYDIGVRQAVEEDAFFSQRPARSTVSAIRETVCLALAWGDLLAAFRASPELFEASFAAHLPARSPFNPAPARPTRLVICPAGAKDQLDPHIKAALISGFEALGEIRLLSADSFGAGRPGGMTFDDPETAYWLQEQELAFDLTIIFADAADGEFATNSLEEADETLLVATAGDPDLAPLEKHALAARGAPNCRLVLPQELGIRPKHIAGWTTPRPCRSFQSIDFTSTVAVQRLCSNILGNGVAIAASSRGVYAAAILGAIQAFEAHGLPVDSFGAAGSAVLPMGLLAHGASAAEIERAFESLARPATWKRAARTDAGLFEPGPIDNALADNVPLGDIAMSERPFAAVSWSLSTGTAEVRSTGLLREAVRANLTPPGILPAVIAADGAILLSGEAEVAALLDATRTLSASPVFFLRAKPSAPDASKETRGFQRGPFRFAPFQAQSSAPIRLDAILAAAGSQVGAVDGDNHFAIPIPAGIGPLDWSEWATLRDLGFEWTLAELAKQALILSFAAMARGFCNYGL